MIEAETLAMGPLSEGSIRTRGNSCENFGSRAVGSEDRDKGTAQLRITSMPGRHGPPVVSALLPEVMGSMLEFQASPGSSPFRLYITGDTLVIDDLKEIPRRYRDIHLALLHLGGTRVMGILFTMDGHEGVELMRLVNPRLAIPIHYDDYDVYKSPISEFSEAGAGRRAGRPPSLFGSW